MNSLKDLDKKIQELKHDSENSLIVVEGIKDKSALNNLGIENIITLKGPLYEEIDKISEKTKEVILLVDLDKEGKKLYHTLKIGLENNGIKINDKFRNFLFKTNLRNIEGLVTYQCYVRFQPKGKKSKIIITEFKFI